MNKNEFKETQRAILEEFDDAFHNLRMLIQTPNPAFQIDKNDVEWSVRTLEVIQHTIQDLGMDWVCFNCDGEGRVVSDDDTCCQICDGFGYLGNLKDGNLLTEKEN